MNEITMQILAWAFSGGAIGSVVTWFINRPKERNKFLKDLQSSIDLLSEKNTTLIKEVTGLNSEVIELRKENARLLSGQEELKRENAALKEEISNLRDQLAGIKTITKTK